MALLNTVMGGVGTNVQPKDNPDPSAAVPSAAAQTVANSLPPPSASAPQSAAAPSAPLPAPAAAPPEMGAQAQSPNQPPPNSFQKQSQKEEEDVDALVKGLGQKNPKEQKAAAKHTGLDEIDSLIGDLGSGDTIEGQGAIVRKDGESGFSAALRSLPEGLKFAGAQMRAHLGRDPKEQRSAFESMYGVENVKTVGKSLYFRPEGDQKFRKVDEPLFNGLADTIIFNALKGIPAGANIVTQLGVDAKTFNPIAGGAAGGAAEALTQQALISQINQFSDIPQENADLKHEILMDAGLNAALPLGLGIAAKVPGIKQAVNKIYTAFKGQAEGALREAGEEVSKAVSVKNAFKEFRETVFPYTKSPEEIGKSVGDAVDQVHKTLSANLDAVKDEAIVLAKQQGRKVTMGGTMGRIADQLKSFKYHVDPDTGLMSQLDGADTSLLEPGLTSAAAKLASFYNRLAAESKAGGTELGPVFDDLENLKKLSAFDMESPRGKDVRNMYKSIRNAATQDRNATVNDLFKGSGLDTEKNWSTAFSNYSQKIDAIGDFKAMFHSRSQRELLVDNLSKSSTADKNEMLDNIKSVLGSDSNEWASLRGGIYQNLVDRNSPNGILNAPELAKALTKPGNQPFISRLFDEKELSVLNRMTLEAQKLSGTDKAITDSQKNVLLKGLHQLFDMVSNPIDSAKMIFSIFGSNKATIDYLTDDAFLQLAKQAQSPAIKKRILDALRTTDAVRSKMEIIYPAKGISKYVPLTGVALSNTIKSTYRNKFEPQNAPSSNPLEGLE